MSSTMIAPAKLIAVMIAVGAAMLLAVLAWSAFAPTSANAASGSQRACEFDGGTYIKDGADSICVYPEESVANENANPDNNGQTTQDTDTGHGNLGNKTVSECTGPPGQCMQQ
jgi:hypothetical protein